MSYSNETSEKQYKSQKGIITALIITNIIFAIIVIFLFVKISQKNDEIGTLSGTVDSKSTEIVTKTKELESLGQDLERIKEEREKLGLQNDSLDSQISTLNSYIAEIKRTSKIDAKKRKELEALIVKLREEITAKDQEIVTLKSQNDSLSTNLTSVTAEKGRLGDSLSSKLKELEYASILKADDIKVTALKENGKELDKEEYKAKQIDRIKITFKIADNKAAKKNNKTFYIRLVTPSGTPFSDANNGGGTIQTADGKDVLYAFSQSLLFDNSRQTVTVIMPKGFNYEPGTYIVAVFAEGYRIGEGGFKVK